jgi:hypothetical protein
VTWTVGLHDDFAPEYSKLREAVQDELLAVMGLLEQFGPQLSRPHDAEGLRSRQHEGIEI